MLLHNTYSPLHPCSCGNRWVLFPIYWQEVVDLFHLPQEAMFPMSYFVYSVNYFACLLITYLVYSENYHVCLLITTRTNQSGEYAPSGSGRLWTTNPCLLWFYLLHNCIYVYICKHTMTPHSSILPVASWAADKWASWTFSEAILTATAGHIIEIDWTSTSTKVSISERNCTCWHAICEHTLLMTLSSFECLVLHSGRLML